MFVDTLFQNQGRFPNFIDDERRFPSEKKENRQAFFVYVLSENITSSTLHYLLYLFKKNLVIFNLFQCKKKKLQCSFKKVL